MRSSLLMSASHRIPAENSMHTSYTPDEFGCQCSTAHKSGQHCSCRPGAIHGAGKGSIPGSPNTMSGLPITAGIADRYDYWRHCRRRKRCRNRRAVGAGAGAGTQVLTCGKTMRAPGYSLLTFRLEHSLQMRSPAEFGLNRQGGAILTTRVSSTELTRDSYTRYIRVCGWFSAAHWWEARPVGLLRTHCFDGGVPCL
jgi:hypothetical protein